ncbi:MAG TPA: SMC-Scp complex subunit ScpB [Phycisphaerae bacterium]|nr:SMC-Scp complex subunit ScpB [Phycisphaerae bacterium]
MDEASQPIEQETPPKQGPEAAEQLAVTAQAVVEAVLFAADGPLPGTKIAQVLAAGDARDVRKHVEALNQRYKETQSAFRIEEIAGGYQMLTLPEFSRWIDKVRRVRSESKLSQAALETLAIIAYRQPILRADIEAIRGVAAGEVINRLRETGLVKIVGRADDVGRPMLYGTTRRFLEVFGLSDLGELPQVEQLKAPGQD